MRSLKQSNWRKVIYSLLTALILITGPAATAHSEPVVQIHYVFHNYAGEYTGQADSGNIPFGFGVFVSEIPVEGELWHYIGQWQDGFPEGEGAIYFENGNMQKGTFSKGILISGLNYTVGSLAAMPVQAESPNEDTGTAYIGNKKSMKFHYPTCRSVATMKESNKVELSSREEAIERHFIPCQDCNP